MYCFVYGSLKKGFRNNSLLTNSKFIQKAVTKPLYKLYNCGNYPGMVKGDKRIQGEIYEINEATLKTLDRLEGVPHLYKRDVVELEDFDKITIAYFYQRDISKLVECGESWQ